MTHAGHRAYKKVDQRNRPCDLIIDNNGNTVIDCVFDHIEWLTEENLVKFRINNKYALCVISDIEII